MADEIVDVISKLGVDVSQAFTELDKLNAKYGQSTEELRKQREELAKLQREEAGILAARAKTNNPSIVAQFNKELEKTQAQITKTNTLLKQNESALKDVGKTGKTLGADIGNAFDGTAKKATSLRSQLRVLKEQLAQTDDDEEFTKLSIEAGKLEDKIQDASDAARIFASDSKFEIIGNAIGNIGSKLLSLDFDGALKGSQALLKASSQITFKDALGGIKQLGQTFANIGKALLTNPLFLIGGAILLIVSNFEKLKNAGGAVGKVFGFIGDILKGVTKSFSDLADAIGLTDTAAQQAAQNIQKYYEDVYAETEKLYDRLAALDKARGDDDFNTQFRKLVKLRLILDQQYNAYRDNLVRQGKSFDDLNEEELKKIKEFGDKKADLQNQQNVLVLTKDREIKEKQSKNDKDAADKKAALDKKIRDLEISNITDDSAKQRATVVAKYNDEFALAKGNATLILELRRQLDNELAKIDEEETKRKQEELDKQEKAYSEASVKEFDDAMKLKFSQLDEEQRHQTALLEIKLAGNKNADVVLLKNQIKFEKDRLDLIQLNGGKETEEYKKQANIIEELEKKKSARIKELKKEEIASVISDTNTVVQSAINAASQILSAEEAKVDKLISLQQKRVDEAAKIAENGNAELLELEKDRLEKLNKEKEKYVRQQQALAVVELISNTAVTVSKAAAEGGAGAAITIAAALIALIAGLASARSIASQAAFYEGGESDGYTGDGNKYSESNALGKKPYIYHKKEFIFNNEKTSKYLDLFRKVHKGEVDLNQMKFESDMYRALKANRIDTSRDIYLRTLPNQSNEIAGLKSSLNNVVEAINSQERMKVIINESGIAVIASKYQRHKQRMNTIAR